jgi:hypothetical protein
VSLIKEQLEVGLISTPFDHFDFLCPDVSTFTTSCVLGNDMVASLSFHSLSYLREKVSEIRVTLARLRPLFVDSLPFSSSPLLFSPQVLESVTRCKVGKMTIMQMMLFKVCSLPPLLFELISLGIGCSKFR